MSIEIVMGEQLARQFGDLTGLAEHVGFFLAEWEADERRLVASDWWPMSDDEYEVLTDYHVSLTDDVRSRVIKWAWDAGKCLIETHSHGTRGIARFSTSDLYGFEEWVPHIFWRLRGRPYAALVTTDESIDGWAWTTTAAYPEQVNSLIMGGEATATSRASMERRRR
jgi:hypothetical protein